MSPVPLHTHEFYSNRLGTTTLTTLYTVPSGFYIVVKHIRMVNPTSTSHQPLISVDSTWLLAAPVLGNAVGAQYDLDTWVALQAGRVLKYSCSSSAATDINISGYLYPVTL